MSISFLLRGLVIGFSIAAPVGPIGVLCIRRTLAEGRGIGFLSGLGAATADAIYGSIAGFGLTFASRALLAHQMWLRLVGGLFLCYLGLKTILSKPAGEAAASKGRGLAAAYASTFFLTLTNPMTILSFAAIFAGLGLTGAAGNYASAAALVVGVFAGSAFWWFLLNMFTGLLRARVTPQALHWVNRISGTIIVGFGLLALLSLKSMWKS